MKLALAGATLLAAISTTALAALDVQFAPGKVAKPYRKILIAPTQVVFDQAFLAEAKSPRNPSSRLTDQELRQLASDMGEEFAAALAESFRKRGFEVTHAAGSDVLRISPALRNLHVNAPDAQSAGMTRSYVREAGGATMVAEVRDPAGDPVASASDESTTTRSVTFELANRVSNRFHFGSMFRSYAEEFAEAIAARK